MTERADRLDLLLRRNRGRTVLPEYLADLSDRLGRRVAPHELAALEDTDDVLSRALGKAESGDVTVVDTGDPGEAASALRTALSALPGDQDALLFVERSDLCGPVRVNPHVVAGRGLLLVRDDEVPVIVTDPDVRFGTYAFADTVSGHAPRRWQVGRWSVGS